MRKIKLSFLVIALLSIYNNVFAEDFYTQFIGGVKHGQVKQFSKASEISIDGWVIYKVSSLESKSLHLLEHRYAINCSRREALFVEALAAENLPRFDLANSNFKRLEGGELGDVLGPVCKSKI